MEPVGLSIPDAQRALGGAQKPISRATIYRLLNAGKLESFKIGTRTMITPDSVRSLAPHAEQAA